MNLIRFLLILLFAVPAYAATTGGIAIPSLPSTNRANSSDLLILESRTIGTNSRTTKIQMTNFADSLTNYGFSKGATGTTVTNLGAGTKLLTNSGIKSLTTDGTVTITDNGTSIAFSAPTNGGITAATATNIMRAVVSTNVYFTSAYLGQGSADLSEGSTTYGPDATTTLQSILNQATNGPITVFWDGRYSSYGLTVYSNTQIIAYSGAGLIMRSNANNSLFKNANRWGTNSSGIAFENFSIEGGIWNGGGYDVAGNPLQDKANASNGWTSVFSFLGVRNATIKDVTIRGPRAFAVHMGNFDRVRITGRGVDIGTNTFTTNRDGYHFNGPGRYLTVDDVWMTTYDDAVNLEANGGGTNCTTCPGGIGIVQTAGWWYGDITDVTLENITFADTAFGIRMLSSVSKIDRVSVKNIKGRTKFLAFNIGVYADAITDIQPVGYGNYGKISFEDIDVETTDGGGTYYDTTFWINSPGGFEFITMKNIRDRNPAFPLIWSSPSNRIQNWTMEGISSTRTNPNVLGVLVLGGTADNLTIANSTFNRSGGGTNLYPINFAAAVKNFNFIGNTVNDYARGIYYPYLTNQVPGFVTNIVSSGNFVTPGWDLSGIATQYIATPNKIAFGSSLTAVHAAAKDTMDLGHDVNVSADAIMNGLPGGGSAMGLFLRGEMVSPWSGPVRKGYFFAASIADNNYAPITISSKGTAAGSDTVLTIVNSTNLRPFTVYHMEFTSQRVNGALVFTGGIKNSTNGLWLTPYDTWSVAPAYVLSYTETNTPVQTAMPQTGVYSYTETATNGTTIFSNITMVAVPPIRSDNILDRGNLGAAASSATLHTGAVGTILKPATTGGRGLLEIHTASGNTRAVVQSDDTEGVFFSSLDTNTISFTIGGIYAGRFTREGEWRTFSSRTIGTGSYHLYQDWFGTNTYQLYSSGGSLDFLNTWNTNIDFRISSNGVATARSNLVAGGLVTALNARLSAVPGSGDSIAIDGSGNLFKTNITGGGGGGSGDMYSVLLSNRVVEVSNRTFTAADLYKLHVLTNGTTNITLTLPTGVEGALIGFRVVASATNFFTISSTSLIDGMTNRVLWATESATLLFDGGTWTKIDGKSRPFYASYGYYDNSGGVASAASAFTKVTVLTNQSDAAYLWLSSSNGFRIPRNGIYAFDSKFRVVDTAGSMSIGQGVGTFFDDGPTFLWGASANNTGTKRNGTINRRIVNAQAGEIYFLFYYLDGSNPNIASANLELQEIPAW